MNQWLIAILAGLLMFGLKALVPVAAGERELPPRAVALTGLVAPAIVGALLAASLAPSGVSVDLLQRLVVLAVAFVVQVKSGSFPLTIGAGLAVHVILAAIT